MSGSISRRGFLAASGAVAAMAATGADNKAAPAGSAAKRGKLIVSPPVLQNAAENSMCSKGRLTVHSLSPILSTEPDASA